ncbi:hypothetical protein [Nocardioides sp. AE5]|uniref:hypothetical protein n=1 Tax=Nocardioides sp. AE5 TaxID=2962573 RepID=UPI002881AE6C|nr:hypothetical protein [Nocardioides sp. AE5]MDT0201498.1 hypothetical protein [Nocardioides sp. AE5]
MPLRRRITILALVVALGTAPLTGCSGSAEDQRAGYCEAVSTHSATLTRIADEEGAGGFLSALPILEELGREAPRDLVDEWATLLNALHGLRDALQAAGLEPDDVAGELPDDLAEAERRRIRGAASVLASPEVQRATAGIEQHALDVCGVSLL